MVRWCCINFQCRGVLLIWIRVGQRPTTLAVGAGGGCLDIFTFVYHFCFFSPSLWETEILSQRAVKAKTTNQPTMQEKLFVCWWVVLAFEVPLMPRFTLNRAIPGRDGERIEIYYLNSKYIHTMSFPRSLLALPFLALLGMSRKAIR